jgi:hypothetical protein
MASEFADGLFSGAEDFFKMFGDKLKQTVSESFSSVTTITTEVDEMARGIATSFGQGTENLMNVKIAMTDAFDSVVKLGGGMKEIGQIQEEVAKGIGKNVILSSESYEKLFAMQKVVGQNAGTITQSFKEAGVSIYNTSDEMQKVIDSAREIGVNAKTVSQSVLNNLDKLNLYTFKNGVEGLAKMASFATATKTDMGAVFTFSEKVYNPEGAIETAAALQRLGVAQSELLNPLRLMDLSANDPEELQKQMTELGKSFVELDEKGRFQIMPGERRRLREIASAMGMQYDQMVKMSIGAADLDRKMNTIKFPDFATEEQKQFISNISEMKDGVYKITTESGTMDVTEALKGITTQEQMDAFIEASKPKDMEDLAKEQLDYVKQIEAILNEARNKPGVAAAATKSANDAIDGIIKMGRATAQGLAIETPTKDIRETMDEVSLDLIRTITKAVKGEATEMDVTKSFFDGLVKTGDLLSGGFTEGLEKAKGTINDLSKTNNDYVKLAEAVLERIGKMVSNEPNTANATPQAVNPQQMNINPATTPQTGTAPGNTPPTTTTQKTDISLMVTLSAPPNIDTGQMEKILQNPLLQQKIIDAVNAALTEQGLKEK